jgi:SAM-dependent methyltransferase
MINKRLPYFVKKVLFGDRNRFGIIPKDSDREWMIWQEKAVSDFYMNTQKKGVGNLVHNLGFSGLKEVDFSQKKVLEVGPGIIGHMKYMKNKPAKYVVCDIREEALHLAEEVLCLAEVPYEAILLNTDVGAELPFVEESFDILISFNSLEHLYPLDEYLLDVKRILKPGGQVVGGIPCEGGLTWGLGRFLTTRRYVHKNYGINYDKIICWEHPNFADFVIERLNMHFKRQHLKLHPFAWLPIDFNLIVSFVFSKARSSM